jgi:nucleoside-diphosphate-sugar epimerase
VKILIVGGAGYVGGFLVDALNESENELRVIDNLTYEEIYLKKVDFRNIDITNESKLAEQLKWADTVIWLAALVGDPACALDPGAAFEINVESLKTLARNFHGRVIFPSTCSVYGAQDGVLSEDSDTAPLSVYAETKLQAERIIKENFDSYLILRLGTLFGISDRHSRIRLDLVLNSLTLRALLDKKMRVFGGNQFRPLLHVRDVGLLMAEQVDKSESGTFNLHTENITIIELAKRIQNLVGEAVIETTDVSYQDARNYQVSSRKAVETLGFRPQWKIEDGIKEIMELVEHGRIKDFTNSRFINVESLKFQSKGR